MGKRAYGISAAAVGLAGLLLFFPSLDSFASAPEEFERGKVIETVICRDYADQSYALYLPLNFNPTVKQPVLFLFDPTARGAAAVEVFRPAAEKFGWILAGSNISRNGPMEANLKAAWTMFQDAAARLPIDENRTYAGGFSGGARAASLFPLVVKRRIAGVIGIAAGISTGIKPQDIAASFYFGIAGLADFNYPEMKQLDAELDNANFPHQILFYEGRHQWPDAVICNRAIGWMEILAMRQGSRAKDDALIDEILGRERQIASDFAASGKIYWAARQNAAISQQFAGLRYTDDFAAVASRLERSPEYADFLKKERRRDEKDASLRRDYARACSLIEDAPGDRRGFLEILRALGLGSLRKETKEGGTWEDRSLALRVLFLISIETGRKGYDCYARKDWLRASSYYELAVASCLDKDPRLKFLCVNLATMYALLGDVKTALKHLETAVDKGFSEVQDLETDTDLEKIRHTPKFRELIERLKKKRYWTSPVLISGASPPFFGIRTRPFRRSLSWRSYY